MLCETGGIKNKAEKLVDRKKCVFEVFTLECNN